MPALTTLLAQWHSHTDYCVEQSGQSVLVPTGRGVRQGCRAAPLLWNVFLDQLFQRLAAKISPDWVRKTVTAFADDIHQGSIFRSRQQLLLELARIGMLLDALEDMGLTLSLEKSYILIEIAGTHSRKIKSKLLKQEGAITFVEIPRADGSFSRIPVKRKADYLGTCLSYTAFEQLTFSKRVQCARITFHRLRRWLSSPHCIAPSTAALEGQCLFNAHIWHVGSQHHLAHPSELSTDSTGNVQEVDTQSQFSHS
jgi:hypothetical protein